MIHHQGAALIVAVSGMPLTGLPQFIEAWKSEPFDVGHAPTIVSGRLSLHTHGHLACYDRILLKAK